MTMQRVPINDAQNEFHFVMNQVCAGLGPVLITGLHGNAVLVSEAEWRKMRVQATPAGGLTEGEVAPEPAAGPEAALPSEDRL